MLISPEHAERYRAYYAARAIEARPSVWLGRIEALADRLGAYSILDYGSGPARSLSRFLPLRFDVRDYDPGVEALAREPTPAELVVCIHTLEHIEPESLEAVLGHLRSLTHRALFVVVSCEPSTKVLTGGTPWHTLVRDAAWWRARLVGFRPEPTLKAAGREYACLWRSRKGRAA